MASLTAVNLLAYIELLAGKKETAKGLIFSYQAVWREKLCTCGAKFTKYFKMPSEKRLAASLTYLSV